MHEDDQAGRIGELLRYGTVDSVDLAAAKCVVRCGDMLSQPIRWIHGAAGATASWSPPSIGEQVLLLAPEGDLAGAIALRGVHCTAFPPAGSDPRELIRFADGAVIAYDPTAHRLEAVLPDGAIASLIAPGGLTIDADVRITGALEVDQDVRSAGVSLRHHKHLGVQPGGGVSGEPQP